MKTHIRRLGKGLLLAAPLLLGLYGFVFVEKLPFMQSLFNCVCMYCLNYQDPPLNLWIEGARWLAPLATASGVVLLVQHFHTSIRNAWAYCKGNSVAVFGPEEARADLLEELGSRGIPMNDKWVKAHSYVLLGTEQENLAFYQRYQRRLKDKHVYIQCRALPAMATTDPNVHLFCPEETAARHFWKANCPYALSVRKEHQLRITILGFDKLGKELLLSALQYNIFHPQQKIEYHILGEEKGFSRVYHQLHQITDPVFFHPEPWYAHIDLIRESDMVLVTEIPDQLSVVSELSLAIPNQKLFVFAAQQGLGVLQEQNPNIHIFNWQAYARKKDAILNVGLYDLAMSVNLRYAHLYNGVTECKENQLPQWVKLDTFARYSNISTADYHKIRQIMLREKGWCAPLNEIQMEEMAELEHIRWCRYHFLNNWQQGTPKNGKAKDPENRIHQSLIPYAELSENEKDKDRQVVDILLSLEV